MTAPSAPLLQAPGTGPAPPRKEGPPKRRVGRFPLIVGGLTLALLLAAIVTLGSLRMPFEPGSPAALLILFSVSVFVVIAFLVFGFVLLRNLLRLWADRRAGQMGSRFRTKMVFGAMGISLLPVALLFVVSYALLNRTLTKWFPRPLEVATEESVRLLSDMSKTGAARRAEIVQEVARNYASADTPLRLEASYDGIWRLDRDGRVTDVLFRNAAAPPGEGPRWVRTLPSGAEAWLYGAATYAAARAPLPGGALVIGQRMPGNYLARQDLILSQRQDYLDESRQLRTFRLQMLLSLLVITLLLLFSTTWVALFLEKQVTVPVQALAEATREISLGNLEHRVTARAQDELGILVDSFNRMTTQLRDARDRLEESNATLQKAFQEMEQRRHLMETILENVPTGVLSLNAAGAVERVNSSVMRMFGEAAPAGGNLSMDALLGAEAARAIERLMRRSLRMGAVSQELEIALPGRMLHAAVTVSSLGPRRANPGYVVVIDDLSELLHAQKAAAWQEVAQRIAHEIKNPLTPIQLSAQRLERFLERRGKGASPSAESARELESLVAECAGLIEREVATLGNLVDAFSRLARFPEAKLEPVDLNRVVVTALEVFSGRLEGVTVSTELAPNLPPVKADAELLRRVLVNLIDNAAEAMEGAATRELAITTRLSANGEILELVVADSGHGIAPQDKDRLFLPHFSTRQRGTGLGLSIADRIVAEHHGTIRVEDNQPQGARFVIRLPAADIPAAAPGVANGAAPETAAKAAAAAMPAPHGGAKG
jgi:two-component system nitrogen regulation sensor histidine kinase NtrY